MPVDAEMPGAVRPGLLAIGLSLAATVLGLSRFGYGVLLPSMRSDLGWSLARAGSVDTANAVGYLVGAAATPALLRRLPAARLLSLCAIVVTLSLVGCAVSSAHPLLLAWRAIAGVGASALFVTGGVLAARLGSATGRAGGVLGVYYAGVGPGILLTALLAPPVLTAPDRWRAGWWALAGLCAGCALAAGLAARRVPVPAATQRPRSGSMSGLGRVLAAFVLFGIGYVPYTTFAVQYWKQAAVTPATITALWSLLALTAAVSGWVWRRLQRVPDRALVVLLVLVLIAVALPLLSTALPVLALSAALFGGSFLAVSAAVTGLIRLARPEARWSSTLAAFTVAFGGGQVVGPVTSGALADVVGLRAGLAPAAAMVALAVLCAAAHLVHARDPATRRRPRR